MQDRTEEYRWYVTGCNRLDREPLSIEEFAIKWQEYEDHAELLKGAEKTGTLEAVDAALRASMERKIQSDPILKAVLVGQSEDYSGG